MRERGDGHSSNQEYITWKAGRYVMEKKQRTVRLLELMMCRRTVGTMRLMPARHDAPSSSHARAVTAVSSSGPSHKKFTM